MLTALRNFWLLGLPISIFISWQLHESPELTRIDNHTNAIKKNYKNDFFSIEESLSLAYVVDQNRLVINTETEKYLSQIAGLTDGEIDEVLLEKTFPSPAGKKLLQLVNCYKAYKHEEVRVSKDYMVLETNQLVDYRELQDKFFREIAKDIFTDHHNFYATSEAAGIQLVVPLVGDVLVPSTCFKFKNVD